MSHLNETAVNMNGFMGRKALHSFYVFYVGRLNLFLHCPLSNEKPVARMPLRYPRNLFSLTVQSLKKFIKKIKLSRFPLLLPSRPRCQPPFRPAPAPYLNLSPTSPIHNLQSRGIVSPKGDCIQAIFLEFSKLSQQGIDSHFCQCWIFVVAFGKDNLGFWTNQVF